MTDTVVWPIVLRLRGDLKAEVEAFMIRENRKPANAVEQLVIKGLEYERQTAPGDQARA